MHLLFVFLIASLAVAASSAPVAAPETCSNSLLGNASCSCLDSCSEDENCCSDYESFITNVHSVLTSIKSRVPFQRKPLRAGGAFDPKIHKYDLGLFQVTPNKQTGSALVAVHTCLFENFALTGGDRGHDGEDNEFVPDPSNPKWVWRDCTAEFDVVVVTKEGKLASFEDQVRVPPKVLAAFGPRPRPSLPATEAAPLYYAEMTGASATAAYKQALVKALLITSFSGQLPTVQQGKAADFDPTEGRKWALTLATFKVDDEHKGAFVLPAPKPTVHDVSAQQLDQAFEKVAKQARYRVAPLDTIMHKIWDGEQWQDVVDKKHPYLAKVVPSLLEQ